MSFSSSSLHFYALILLALAGPLACSNVTAPETDLPYMPKATSASMRFQPGGTIRLAPGETRSVVVVSSPRSRSPIRFALLGDTQGASLDRALAEADADGAATVSLHAPSQATTFRLRALLLNEKGEPARSAETGVAVSGQGFGKVRVVPQYTGKRAIEGWTASVVARTGCDAISASLPNEPDGALVASTLEDEPVVVNDAPVGPNLAVAIRSGKYLWGCAETADLKPDTTLDIKVTVVEKPIDLAAADLDLALDVEPDEAGYQELLQGATGLLGEAFAPAGVKEPILVLDTMATLALSSAAFKAQRAAGSWDAVTEQHWSGLGTPLRAHIAAFAAASVELGALQITANLKATAGEPSGATFAVTQFLGMAAPAAGIAPANPFKWTAEPDDRLSLSGDIVWQPSRFMGAAAFAEVKAKFPGAAEMPDALAALADCGGLSTKLGGFNGCDKACVEALCHDALGARWEAALKASASAGRIGHLTVTAAGPAELDDAAKPVGFSGNWVGTVSDGVVMANAQGTITGSAARSRATP